jgi:hypothetical protein
LVVEQISSSFKQCGDSTRLLRRGVGLAEDLIVSAVVNASSMNGTGAVRVLR